MTNIKWGIFVPRLEGAFVYSKYITVFAVEDDNVIGARRYTLDGVATPISVEDIEYWETLSTSFDELQYPGWELKLPTHTSWLFKTEAEAYLQKLILLDNVRDEFIQKQEEDKIYFDEKIPPSIKEHLQDAKHKYPELML